MAMKDFPLSAVSALCYLGVQTRSAFTKFWESLNLELNGSKHKLN